MSASDRRWWEPFYKSMSYAQLQAELQRLNARPAIEPGQREYLLNEMAIKQGKDG